MKSLLTLIGISLSLILGTAHAAQAAPTSKCYRLHLSLSPDLDGSSARTYLKTQYRLCITEKDVVKEADNISTGDFTIRFVDGDFTMMGYRLSAKSTKVTFEKVNIVYAKDIAGLTGENSKRIQLSLNKNSAGEGVYHGQISIAGTVYALF